MEAKQVPIHSITPIFDADKSDSKRSLYWQLAIISLKEKLPKYLWKKHLSLSQLHETFTSSLPILETSFCDRGFGEFSFFLICKRGARNCKFFYDILIRSLSPKKPIDVLYFFASHFRIENLGEDVYSFCELTLQPKNSEESSLIRKNLPIAETNVRLGVASERYAKRILEMSGLTYDEKIIMIQERVGAVAKRFSQTVSEDVIYEMQYVLVTCQETFKIERSYNHLAKVIITQYLFRKGIRQAVKKDPANRYLHVRLFRAWLNPEGKKRKVLGILVGMNFLQNTEIFEKRHLATAIRSYVPNARPLNNSFFVTQRDVEEIRTFYLEVEKVDGQEFTSAEIRALRQGLHVDLKDSIEHLLHPVFMPRNEEEVIRNILSLSNQIRYLEDIPQVMISFDEQTHLNLLFTVTLVRILGPEERSIQETFMESNSSFEYIHDRSKLISYMKKKYVKEAHVFRLKFSKEPFLRNDGSIDLYKARHAVTLELEKVIGEFRDFNGGMLAKQTGVLHHLHRVTSKERSYNELILENFFYSITPVVMRSILEVEQLKELFLTLLDFVQASEKKDTSYKFTCHGKYVCAVIQIRDNEIKEQLQKSLSLFLLGSTFSKSMTNINGNSYISYLYSCSDLDKQQLFFKKIELSLDHALI